MEKTKSYSNNLQRQILAIFVLSCVLLGAILIYLQQSILAKNLIETQLQKHTLAGNNVIGYIDDRLMVAESLASAIANTSQGLKKEESEFKKIIPLIINKAGYEGFIAGGGFWPEPYTFDKAKERSSFFWGRNKDGVLEYFDDYNKPEGNGYHREEWYVPARFSKNTSCYWSKSYVDPYSYQPMVTCTIPIFEKELFTGVSTIDLKLEGLGKLLDSVVKEVGGYGFIVDRNNKFIYHPDEKGILVGGAANGPEAMERVDSQTYATRVPTFTAISKLLDTINEETIAAVSKKTGQNSNITEELQKRSYQINGTEADLIQAIIFDQKNNEANNMYASHNFLDSKQLEIESDEILKEPAYVNIVEMPQTHWKVVLVTPKSFVLSKTKKSITLMVSYTVGVIFIIFGFFLIFLKHNLFKPIQRIITSIKNNFNDNKEKLNENVNNELGEIAYWYNLRTKEMIEAKNFAEESAKSKAEFLSNMSHELRTPMHAILNYTKMSIKKVARHDTDALSKYLNNTFIAGTRLLGLLNNLLDLAKLESGKMILKFKKNDFKEAYDNTIVELDSLLKEKQLQIIFDNKLTQSEIIFDKERIIQVLVNLFSNAIKFTPEGSKLYATMKEATLNDAQAVQFTLQDSGAGIQEEELKLIFDKFIQSSKTSTGAGGTGLGLSICKQIVEAHNGITWAENAKEKGAIFNFIIPCNPILDLDGNPTMAVEQIEV